MPDTAPYFRPALSYVHDQGFGFHADNVAPGVLALLEPVRGGTVLEIGAGSGALTRHLVAAGLQVVATDASPAMVSLGRERVPGPAAWRRLALPDDPLPPVDAVVGAGHALNYLPDAGSVERALVAVAAALRPGGVLALDLCDLRWGDETARASREVAARLGEDWALLARFSLPAPDRYVRELTTFVRNGDGTWRRDDERHENVLVDVGRLAGVLAAHGVDARAGSSFGGEHLPPGLMVLTGRKR